MVRVCAIVLAVAACGRIGFDPDPALGNGDGSQACTVPIATIRLGHVSTIALGVDGHYYGMGANMGNELLLAGTNYDVPTPLPALDGFSQIALGLQLGTATASDGSLWAWGQGEPGMREVSATTDWHSLAAAWAWGCAMHSDATLWCWGDNYQGNLGDGTMNDSDTPLQIGVPPVASFAIGVYVACAIDTTGALWCWGANDRGQSGTGACCNAVTTPARVGTDTDWAQIAVGSTSECARKTDGSLWCWGQGYYDGTTGDLHVPTRVGARNDWIDLATSFSETCATAADHSLWCYGDNTNGQLGLGAGGPQYELTPVQVPLGPVDAFQLGGHDVCATIGGQLWCWGRNDLGMLGIGSFEDVDSPIARCP
jgi:alpha-tubulin suppressor-like RCC1 family protein